MMDILTATREEIEKAADEVDQWIKLHEIAQNHRCKCDGVLKVLEMQLVCSNCQDPEPGRKINRPWWTTKKKPIINLYREILDGKEATE